MAQEEGKQEGKGFVVQDRRRFSESGEARPEAADTVEKPSEPGPGIPRPEPESHSQPFPEMNFSTFIISLSTQALMHLGEIKNPFTGNVEADISLAKQTIDIIGILRDKTRGNLDQGEDQLMEEVLYDLRMKYVEAVKKK
ncbi:MAG TPA: DUF1844 domain-containing protein [Candidatus Binatia bacterium]|jgi:hypothetical protein